MNQFYTIAQVAELLDVHHRTVRAWIDSGQLKAVKVGRLYRIPKDVLDSFTTVPTVPMEGGGADGVAPRERLEHVESLIAQLSEEIEELKADTG